MWVSRLTMRIALCAVASVGFLPSHAQAGPLIDWLFGRNRAAPAYPVGQPVAMGTAPMGNTGGAYGAAYQPGYAANFGSYYGSQMPVIGPTGAGYPLQGSSGIAATTMPSTLSYVPNFRTNSYRAPVTYYRPLMTTDPNTNSQVVAMAPCTSYEYQTQRVPALGRSALYGSNSLPSIVPAPAAFPTYTLPSGGIPLAYNNGLGGMPIPNNSYSSAYRGYSALQPQTTMPSQFSQTGNYATQQFGTSPYYGGTYNGGCTGGFAAPINSQIPNGQAFNSQIPGLVAPQEPSAPAFSSQPPLGSQPMGAQSFPAPANSLPTTPFPSPGPSATPNFGPPPVLPQGNAPFGAPSADPAANVPPSLPPIGYSGSGASASNQTLKPQLRGIYTQPREDSSNTYSQQAPADYRDRSHESERSSPVMSPIPLPEGFENERRWNPGLLKEGDMTAETQSDQRFPRLRPISPELAQYAGQSKPIHWASFENNGAELDNFANRTAPESTSRLRPVVDQPTRTAPGRSATPATQPQRPAAPTYHYDSSGWKTAR